MNGRREQLAERARTWIAYSRADLGGARLLIGSSELPPWMAAFHAQQCAEKALKAFLVMHLDDVPLTHNIQRLLDECSAFANWPENHQDAASLTAFGVGMKYPSQLKDVTRDIAEESIRIAAQVLSTVETVLKNERVDLN